MTRIRTTAILAAALASLVGAPGLAQNPSALATPATLAIDEGQFVPVNGIDQWVTVRGRKRDNPVILVLHGGPGFPMSFLAPMYADWEEDFTIVQWDQPATGGTFLKNQGSDSGPLTIDRYVRDGLAVTEWARRRLGAKKIVLLGTSWGSIIGVEMAHRRPDLFSAYVGAAQVVGPEGARVGYDLALDAARKRNDAAATAALVKVGPPPYRSFADFMVRQQYSNPPGLPATPEETGAFGEMMAVITRPDPAARYNAPLPVPAGYDGGLMAALKATWTEAWAWDARKLGTRFEVPVFIFQGQVDVNTPTSVARTYFDEIAAPTKAFEVVPAAGHNVVLFHRELLALLRKHVLPVAR